MPLIDQQYRYSRLPQKPSPGFPDLTEIWWPLVEVALARGGRGVRVKALVDTGAAFCFFPTQYADVLGLDWRTAPQVPYCGVGGTEFTGHVLEISLHLVAAKYTWPTKVVFSPTMNSLPLPLLGHIGFFEHFEVRLKSTQREFRVFLK